MWEEAPFLPVLLWVVVWEGLCLARLQPYRGHEVKAGSAAEVLRHLGRASFQVSRTDELITRLYHLSHSWSHILLLAAESTLSDSPGLQESVSSTTLHP